MKNELPELTPKPDSWDKIMHQADFESQLGNHLSRLPQYSPNEEAWGKITGKMDRKKTVPIWIKWSVAASILGFLCIAGLSTNRFGKNNESKNQELQTSLSLDSELEKVGQDSTVTEPLQSRLLMESAIGSTLEAIPEKIITRRNVELIGLPKINLPELEPTHLENIHLKPREKQTSENSQPKTLHQVSISWSKIKTGFQVKTPFGEKGLDPTNQTQAASQPSQHITIQINN